MSAASVRISSERNGQLRALCQDGDSMRDLLSILATGYGEHHHGFDPLGNFSRNRALIQIQ